MNPERWKRIEEAFNAALELPEGARAAFLDGICGEDSAFRLEVERLLQADSSPPVDVQSLIGEAAASFVEPVSEPDLSGTSIGHYAVLRRIGTGGMGAVYLALDGRLGRRVALKVVPESFRRDADRMRRFELEARTLSALNHPNIITLHDIETTPELLAIVTEYVEGETLGHRLLRGRLSVGEVTEIGAQVAEALAEAHQTGIVHRDVKPGNIMLTSRGGVKVLDFGLAKVLGSSPVAMLEAAAETISGMVLGTVRYMSPEQARSLPVDHRTDIFSLGAVLFEMVTGAPAFGNDSAVETLQRIISGQRASPENLSVEVPAELLRIINKCLENDPNWRYQSAGDVAVDLRALRRAIDSGAVLAYGKGEARPGRRRGWVALVATGVVLAALAEMFVWRGWLSWKIDGARDTAPASFTRLTSEPGEELFPTVSPDGQSVIYAAGGDLYLQRVGGRNAVNLTPDSDDEDTQPAYSPDGGRVAFRSERDGGGIFLMGATGESVRRLTDFGFNPAWSHDGHYLAVASEGGVLDIKGRNFLTSELWLIDVDSAASHQLIVPDAVQPSWSPRDLRIAYWAINGGNPDIWTVPVQGGSPRRVTDDAFNDWNPVWAPDGKSLIFASVRGGTPNLWQVQIDEQSGEVSGMPQPLLTPSSSVQHFASSGDGTVLAYVDQNLTMNLRAFAFDPVESAVTGPPTMLTEGSNQVSIPSVSPDGAWIAFQGLSGTNQDLFVMRSDGSGMRQLTDDAFRDRYPNWSADSHRLIFYSDRTGSYQAWSIALDGSDLQPEVPGQANVVYPRWSPDGKTLSYSLFAGKTYLIRPGLSPNAQSLPDTEPDDSWFIGWAWAPDSERLAGWLGFNNQEHGGIVIYSVPGDSYHQLTRSGQNPLWLHDGQRLFFIDEGKLSLIDLSTGSHEQILDVSPDLLEGCAISPDDKTLYCNQRVSEADIWVMRRDNG